MSDPVLEGSRTGVNAERLKTSDICLTRMRLCGIVLPVTNRPSAQTGLIRVEPASLRVAQLYVPPRVALLDGALKFDSESTSLLAKRVPDDLLERFVNLGDDASVLAFAKEFGPLGIEGPESEVHRTPVSPRFDQLRVESLAGWYGYVNAAKAVIGLIRIAKGHASRLGEDAYRQLQARVSFPGSIRTRETEAEELRRKSNWIDRTKVTKPNFEITGRKGNQPALRFPTLTADDMAPLDKKYPTNWDWWRKLGPDGQRKVAGTFVAYWINTLLEVADVRPTLIFNRSDFAMSWVFGKSEGRLVTVTLLGVIGVQLVSVARGGRWIECEGCDQTVEARGKEKLFCWRCGKKAANRVSQRRGRAKKR